MMIGCEGLSCSTVIGHCTPPGPTVTVIACVGAAGYAGYSSVAEGSKVFPEGREDDEVKAGGDVVGGGEARSGFWGNGENGCGWASSSLRLEHLPD